MYGKSTMRLETLRFSVLMSSLPVGKAFLSPEVASFSPPSYRINPEETLMAIQKQLACKIMLCLLRTYLQHSFLLLD